MWFRKNIFVIVDAWFTLPCLLEHVSDRTHERLKKDETKQQ